MNASNLIQLPSEKIAPVIAALQHLLADFQIHYTNLRGFHWNVKGPGFFTLHAQFEKMYDDASEKADQLAERILMLGGTPDNRFSDYLRQARIQEIAGVHAADEAIRHILATLQHLIGAERSLLSMASDAGDEATVSLMSDYLAEQEKSVWMLNACLG